MNRYGRIALDHWKTSAPTRYAAIPDPETFFAELGEQMAREVQTLALDLAGPDPAGEEYLAKVGRLNAARSQAEELVLHETAYVSDDPNRSDSLSEDLEEGPDVDLVHQAQAAIDRARLESDSQEA